MFLILWPLALFLLYQNRKDKYLFWIVLFLLAGGGGSYFFLTHSVFIPYFEKSAEADPIALNILHGSVLVFMYAFFYLIPYFFLMSALSLAFPAISRTKRATLLLLIPSILYAGFQIQQAPQAVDIERIRMWASLYIGIASALYVTAWIKEKEAVIKRNILRLTVVFVPINFWVLTKEYLYSDRLVLLPNEILIENPGWTFKGNPVEIWLLILLIFYSIRYGFLGIKVRIERQRLGSSMRTISSGSALINHAIKNDVNKIEYMLERIESHAKAGNTEEILSCTKKIAMATGQLKIMSGTIKEKSDEIVLDEQPADVSELIERLLQGLEPVLLQKRIRVETQYCCGAIVRCDRHHFTEALSNLVTNAIEAMEAEKGLLRIDVGRHKNRLTIDVRDNGRGIEPENQASVFEPFFTTKKHSAQNYGLGLSYSYHVLQKHGGDLKLIESRINEGTSFRMMLPKRRIVKWISAPEKEEVHPFAEAEHPGVVG